MENGREIRSMSETLLLNSTRYSVNYNNFKLSQELGFYNTIAMLRMPS